MFTYCSTDGSQHKDESKLRHYVPYAPIAEIDFTTQARKRQKMFGELPEGGMEVVCEDVISTSNIIPTNEELEKFYMNVVNLRFCPSFLVTPKPTYLCD